MSAGSFAGYLAWMMEMGGKMRYIAASLGCILHCCFMNGMNGFLFLLFLDSTAQ
jgi:hypothetical protein